MWIFPIKQIPVENLDWIDFLPLQVNIRKVKRMWIFCFNITCGKTFIHLMGNIYIHWMIYFWECMIRRRRNPSGEQNLDLRFESPTSRKCWWHTYGQPEIFGNLGIDSEITRPNYMWCMMYGVITINLILVTGDIRLGTQHAYNSVLREYTQKQ